MMNGLLRNIFSFFSRVKTPEEQGLEILSKRTPENLGLKVLKEMKRKEGARELEVAYLCTIGADVNIRDENGETALIPAIKAGSVPIVMHLLIGHADPNARDKAGTPALMLAMVRDDLDMVRMLVHHGADVHAKDVDGDTALTLVERWAQKGKMTAAGFGFIFGTVEDIAAVLHQAARAQAEAREASIEQHVGWIAAGMPVDRPKGVKLLKLKKLIT